MARTEELTFANLTIVEMLPFTAVEIVTALHDAVDVTIEDTGNGKEFIITSGLKPGDRIVTTGANNVTEGQKVLFPKEEVESEKK